MYNESAVDVTEKYEQIYNLQDNFFKAVKTYVAKGEIVYYVQFLLLPKCFIKVDCYKDVCMCTS